MGKNIILCSDGTGNKGGYGADTNVYKLYNAIDIHNPQKLQITFYDDGVGTNTNKYLRVVTGAFGLGFGANIKDLYSFLARNYEFEDEIYLFGFSRGAATVRAFAGMIQECGLLDINNSACQTKGVFDERKFQDHVDKAFKAYEKIESNASKAGEFKKKAVTHPKFAPDGALKIKMIGVWDTVSALGFPQDWSWTVWSLDKFFDYLFPHTFYNYRLNSSVENVFHALAIDDERKTFHPKIWNENRKDPQGRPDRPVNIEQVWFAGAHSNVGGGYPRAGLSLCALDWMMTRAHHHGIQFKQDIEDEVRAAANVHDKLYDSRDGVAVYYRYSPRDIEELCTKKDDKKSHKAVIEKMKHWMSREKTEPKSKIKGPIKIHKAVIDRIERGTSRYAPGFLPDEYEIVDTPIGSVSRTVTWTYNRSEIRMWVALRKCLYRVFVEATLVLVAASGLLWMFPPEQDFPEKPIPFFDLISDFDFVSVDSWASVYEWAARHFADILHYILPEYIEPFITYALIVNPYVTLGVGAGLIIFYYFREFLREGTQRASEKAHRLSPRKNSQASTGGQS